MSNPVGFWSYARSDDAHSDGQLSQLRTIVGKAIALQYGADITIWQDIQAIPPGADWAASIERTISQTVFFMPIVTPRYLKSTNCLAEFQSFHRRMIELGRDDLIFPILYVGVDQVGADETPFGQELEALRRHQWIDFRPLRHADPRSHEVWTWVDGLAENILKVAVPVSKAERAAEEARQREGATKAAEQPTPPHVNAQYAAIPAPAAQPGIAAAPGSMGQPTAAPVRKRRIGVLAASAGGLVVVAGALAAVFMRQEAPHPPTVIPASTPVASPPALPAASEAGSATPQPHTPDLQGSVDRILDSASLIVSGKTVNLYGIRGEDGRPALSMQHYLESEGNLVQCFARDEAYQCFANGRDIAGHAVLLGWARTRQGAPPEYDAVEHQARRARLGIWAK